MVLSFSVELSVISHPQQVNFCSDYRSESQTIQSRTTTGSHALGTTCTDVFFGEFLLLTLSSTEIVCYDNNRPSSSMQTTEDSQNGLTCTCTSRTEQKYFMYTHTNTHPHIHNTPTYSIWFTQGSDHLSHLPGLLKASFIQQLISTVRTIAATRIEFIESGNDTFIKYFLDFAITVNGP